MTAPDRQRPASAWAVTAALIVVYVVWGSTYLAIAVMIETLPPLLAAGARYGSAGAILLGGLAAVMVWKRRRSAAPEPVTRPGWAEWRAAAIVGTLLLLGGNGGVVLAELFVPSGIAALLIAAVPIWMALFEAIATRRRPSGLVMAGLAAGIFGVAVLLVPLEGFAGFNPLGIGLLIVAEISWAIGSVYARRAPLPRNGILATGMEMLAGGAALFVVGLALGELGRADPAAFSLRSLIAVAYLVIFGSVLAFTAYTWLLAHAPMSTVATYAYVNPIVAVALGALVLGEEITPRTIVAGVVIIAAVVAMVSGRPRAEVKAAPEPAAVPARATRDAMANE